MTDENPNNPYQAPDSTTRRPARPDSPELASRLYRCLGSISDGLVQLLVIGPIIYFTGIWDALMQGSGDINLTTSIGLFIAGELIFLALQGWLLFNRQQTIGKAILNMRIVGMEQDNVPAGKLYGLRYLVFHVLAQLPGVNLIMIVDPLLIFRSDRRCLHDHLAGTRVIQTQSTTA